VCHQVRLKDSVPVLERLREWVDTTRPRVPPKTALGKALAYLDNPWPGLICFLEDGRLEIDNNAAENAIRPFGCSSGDCARSHRRPSCAHRGSCGSRRTRGG
jgi:hypothetical protein